MAAFERLTALDASFVYAERPPVQVHVGSLLVFEDSGLRGEELASHVESRLHRIPRFRQRLMDVPMGLGLPVWVDDEHFDISFHVRSIGLARPGGERELLELMGRLQSVPLDRTRPLWELWCVDLPGARQALIQKTHHAMVDGISGVDVLSAIVDLTPETPEEAVPEWRPEPAPTPAQLAAATVGERLTDPARLGRSAWRLLSDPRRALQRGRTLAGALPTVAGTATHLAPQTSLNADVGSRRRFDVVRASLDDVKAAKNRHGVTVNDVVLAAVGGGLGDLLRSRGELTPDLALRVLVPVSMRPDDQRFALGNQVGALVADLPVGEADPLRRLRRIHEQMAMLKGSHEADIFDVFLHASDHAPRTLVALAARAAVHGRHFVNAVITNVPGPPLPLYLRGAQMLEAFPYVPLSEDTTVGVAIASYNGALNMGLTGDWDTTADLDVLASGIEKALGEY